MKQGIEHTAHLETEQTAEEVAAQTQQSVSENLQTEVQEKNYSYLTLGILFFIMSATGWFIEIIFYLIRDGVIINPGVLHGPWVPIYGVGGICILVLLKDWKKSPAATFLFIIILCGVVEFITGLALELMTGAKWWDYSNFFFNIEGYVCLEALLLFGVIGMLFVYRFAPACERWLSNIPNKTQKIVLGILLVLFVVDIVFSLISPNYAAAELNRIAFAGIQNVLSGFLAAS